MAQAKFREKLSRFKNYFVAKYIEQKITVNWIVRQDVIDTNNNKTT